MTPKPKGQNKPTSGMKDWESELASFLNAIPGDIDVPVAYDELKLFIRILLTQSRQEMVEEITRWRDEMCDDGGDWFQKNHWANQLFIPLHNKSHLLVCSSNHDPLSSPTKRRRKND